jgi:hypothetical protein
MAPGACAAATLVRTIAAAWPVRAPGPGAAAVVHAEVSAELGRLFSPLVAQDREHFRSTRSGNWDSCSCSHPCTGSDPASVDGR